MQKKDIIYSISEKSRQILPSNARVILFGSQARGDEREDSDWDILILVEQSGVNNEDFNRYAYPFVELGWRIGIVINPLLYTFTDWKKRHYTPFYKNVERESILLCH